MSGHSIAVAILSLCCDGVIIICPFMLARNSWVYNARIGLIRTDMWAYYRLPSYYAMMWRFWVWNVEAFLRAQ